MSRRDARGLVAVALGAFLLLGARGVAAEDAVGEPAKPAAPAAPMAPPMPRQKIAHAYLDSLVGSWDLTMKPTGQPEQKGRARWWKALDGTALVEELVAGEGPQAFFGYGVLYLGADGKSLSRWWFDSMGQGEVWALKGSVADDGWTLKDESYEHIMKKTANGHAYTMKMGGAAVLEIAYAKAASDCPSPPVVEARAIKQPFLLASLGEYAVKSAFKMGEMTFPSEGTATIRLGVGGSYAIEEYDATHAGGKTVAIGVMSVGADGKSTRQWWFTNYEDAPVVVVAEITETEVRGKGTGPNGTMDVVWSKTATGYETKATLSNGATMTETYTRKK